MLTDIQKEIAVWLTAAINVSQAAFYCTFGHFSYFRFNVLFCLLFIIFSDAYCSKNTAIVLIVFCLTVKYLTPNITLSQLFINQI